MKILFQYLYGGGGGLSSMKLLLRALAARESIEKIFIVCSRDSELNELSDERVVHIVNFEKFKNRELNRLAMGAWGLKKIVEKYQPDIVISMNLGSYRHLSVPSLLSINNAYQVYPRDVLTTHPKNLLSVLVLRWFFRRSMHFADGAIVQTGVIKGYLEQQNPKGSPIWVLPKAAQSEVDFAAEPLLHAARERLAKLATNGQFRFLYVATCIPHKNHQVLVKAMDILRARSFSCSIILTVSAEEICSVGGSEAASLIESGHLVPLGWVKKAQLEDLYRNCDACLMPSILESLSSTHIEAMAWSKAMISSDLKFAREVCEDASLYCQPNNAGEWADVMYRIAGDSALRLELAEKGRRVVGKMPASTSEVAELLEKILGEARNRANLSASRSLA